MNEYVECYHCQNMIEKNEQTTHILEHHPDSEDAKRIRFLRSKR
jgi:hypothetical protein